MLRWFRPKPPLDTFEKTWVERRMRWLVAQFGIERLRQSTILLPSNAINAEGLPETESELRVWMEQLAVILEIDPSGLSIEIHSEKPATFSGLYIAKERVICIHEDALQNRAVLIKTLAHELAHDLLIKKCGLALEIEDHEWVTDLLPLVFGFGVLFANCTVEDFARTRVASAYWEIYRVGYLPSRMLGYALALFALARNEDQPPWMQLLRRDAVVPMKQGLEYIKRTGDCVFDPRKDQNPPSGPEVYESLRNGSPTVKLDAIWEVRDRNLHTLDAMNSLVDLIHDADPHVGLHAIKVLGDWTRELDDRAYRTAGTLIESRDIDRCVCALQVLANGKQEVPRLIFRLDGLLRGDIPTGSRIPVLEVLSTLGRDAEPLVPLVMPLWKRAIADGSYSIADETARMLLTCVPEPQQYVEDWFEDSELRSHARRTLRMVARDALADSATGTTRE